MGHPQPPHAGWRDLIESISGSVVRAYRDRTDAYRERTRELRRQFEERRNAGKL